MDNIVYIEGVGYCKEVTVNRYNDGVNEPYNIYEPIKRDKTMNKYKVTIKGYDAPGTPAGPDVCVGIVEIITDKPNSIAACGQYAHLGDIISVIELVNHKNI